MTLKVLLLLSLLALAKTQDNGQKEGVAYSSVYTSFGSHEDFKFEPKEYAITNAPVADNKPIQSAPIHETMIEGNSNNQEQANSGSSNMNNDNSQIKNRESIIYSIPNIQAEPTTSEAITSNTEAKTVLVAVTAPPIKKVSSNPVFSPAFIGKDRLITPGLSAFASMGEVYEGEIGKVTVINAKTSQATNDSTIAKAQETNETPKKSEISLKSEAAESQTDEEAESHASFDGFGATYSW